MITCYVEKDGTVSWGRGLGKRNPVPSFKKCIEDNPFHQLSAIVEYCLYNTDNCFQLDKINITNGLEKIKVLIPESEWPKAINKLMDQVIFYNGTGRDCLFDYSDTKYGQLEGDPRQEIYDILLVYMDEMQVDEASKRYILNNADMYKERFSFLQESAKKYLWKRS